MNHISSILLALLLVTNSCATPPRKVVPEYAKIHDTEKSKYQLNEIIEVSQDDEPSWISKENHRCQGGYCGVGRIERLADESTAFSCLRSSKLIAKTNLTSTVKAIIGRKSVLSGDSYGLDHQQLHLELFQTNISRLAITASYYRKKIKNIDSYPTLVIQCYSLARISLKTYDRKIKDTSTSNASNSSMINKEYNRYFKINKVSNGKVRYSDITPRQSTNPSTGSLSDIRSSIIRVSKSLLNVPYLLGGMQGLSDGRLDCSDFVKLVYSSVGLKLPRGSTQQFTDYRGKAVHDLQVGDLLFFSGFRPYDQVSHVSIYIGNNQMIHSNSGAGKVSIDTFNDYWRGKFLGARRYLHSGNLSLTNIAMGD